MTDFVSSIPVFGSIVDASAVATGAMIGLAVHSKLPGRFSDMTFQVFGLFSIFLGMSMAMGTQNLLVLLFGLLSGSLAGEFLDIESRIRKLGDSLKQKARSTNEHFTEGLLTSFLLFCVGSMTVLGAIEEGLGGFPAILLTKSIMDGFAAIALAASLGSGVLFSALPLFVFQGGLTLLTRFFGAGVPDAVIGEITAAGGILIMGIALSVLGIRNIRVSNMLPGLVTTAALAWLFL